MAKINLKKWAQAGTMFGILAALISLAYTAIFKNGIANISFVFADIDVGAALKSGTDTGIGGKLLGMLNGFVPVSGTMIGTLISVAISGFIVFVVGRWVYEKATFFRAKGNRTRLMAVALYGSLIVGAALALISGKISSLITWGFLQVTAATAIAFLIVASVYVILNNFIPKIAILPE